jgi:glycosyltransferase involved in cell wall biosynthesis
MKISVCVPVSRVESILPLLQSIQRQTWKDWELVAVGQGTCENPRVKQVYEIIETAGASDKRIRYVHIDEAGATRAKNAAIRAASGSLIAEIDDDAEASANWLQTMVEYFHDKPEVDVLGGSVLKPVKTRPGIAVCPSVIPAEAVYHPFLMSQPPPGWNWISCNVGMRAEVFDRVGYYDDYLGPGSTFPAADDTDLLLRFEAAGIVMGSSPRLVVHHTYGYRYGLKAFTRHQYNYAYGNGGLAAKLVLAGDPRGKEWLDATRRDRLLGWLRPFRPHRFLRSFYGWSVFSAAYEYCLREFQVQKNLLAPRI